MKERLLVLAKACPEISSKYESLVCVAGITDKGEWRRIYPIPWKVFWKTSSTYFKKKTWIEYELQDNKPSDHRPESRKIKFETIKMLREASFKEIQKNLNERLSTIEDIESKGAKVQSIGVLKPLEILDFSPTTNQHYESLLNRSSQLNLFGKKAIHLDIPKYKYRYIFKDDKDGRIHEMLCEDWEVGELHRKCEEYRIQGKYKNEEEVQEKVRQKFLELSKNSNSYFIVGSHFRFPTFMIVGLIYPKKSDNMI